MPKKTVIFIPEGTTNRLADGVNYLFATDENGDTEDEPNATLFSKDDLTICGTGQLAINANFSDAITSKDGLILKETNFIIEAADDGIRGKDYLIVKNSSIDATCQGDGLKSDNSAEEDRGYIYVEAGNLTINANSDGLQAATDILITAGNFKITTAGGSQHSVNSTATAKAVKASVAIIIDGGSFDINSADDAIHANESVAINNGIINLASGDDGVHADAFLSINGGEINISKSYEGIESANITINAGTIDLVASDDGINCAGGNDGSGMHGWSSNTSSNYYLYINGGFIHVNSSGDGLDANGSIVQTNGTVLVDGPISSGNGALDYDTSFKISGGILIAVGSSGMAQAPQLFIKSV